MEVSKSLRVPGGGTLHVESLTLSGDLHLVTIEMNFEHDIEELLSCSLYKLDQVDP